MNQIIDWMQNNWYEFGSLIAQFTFLFAGLWFARKILIAMRATQQQFGALLRLSIADGLEEHSRQRETIHEFSSAEAPSVVTSKMFTTATEQPLATPTAPPEQSSTSYAAFERPVRGAAPSLSEEMAGRARISSPVPPVHDATTHDAAPPDPTPFVAAPLTLPEEEHGGNPVADAGRGVVQWLQSPVASKSNGDSALRKIVRWLQAPARS
jgi:hypothetical protein